MKGLEPKKMWYDTALVWCVGLVVMAVFASGVYFAFTLEIVRIAASAICGIAIGVIAMSVAEDVDLEWRYNREE